jgi:hypothetical protein
MTRRDWIRAERAFNRREPLEDDMGSGRWSMRSVGGEERHTIEFGFKYRFDVRAGPKSDGIKPDLWWASSREGALGDYPTLEAAMRACEDEARRLIEAKPAVAVVDFDANTIREQWSAYLASPKRLRSVKTRTRYK